MANTHREHVRVESNFVKISACSGDVVHNFNLYTLQVGALNLSNIGYKLFWHFKLEIY